jgi:hypothetical protein
LRKGLRVVGIDPEGWLILDYRGARIRSRDGRHALDLPAHPSHGATAQDARHWMHVIDAWNDGEG